eukprot:c22123_g3_i2 orf=147-770(+)
MSIEGETLCGAAAAAAAAINTQQWLAGFPRCIASSFPRTGSPYKLRHSAACDAASALFMSLGLRMEGVSVPPNPRTVDEIFRDFKGRRAGLLKALTSEVEEFFRQSDPEKENLCLYGFPDEAWEVNLPAEEVPPEIPEPALGINFARDGMNRKDWLSLVAVHSDAWLLAVAFFYGARFDKTERSVFPQAVSSLVVGWVTLFSSVMLF